MAELWLALFIGGLAPVRAELPGDQRIYGPESGAGFARELAVGRFDPSGRPTLVVAAARHREAGEQRGQILLFPCGPAGLDTNAVRSLSAPAGSFGLGFCLAAGDVNGDGLDDLLVGALSAAGDDTRIEPVGQRVPPTATGVPAAEDAANAPVLVHLFAGSAAGLEAKPSATLRLPRRGAFRELRLAAGGDLDGDGVGDFVVGLPDLGGGAGEVWLFRGRRQGGWREPDQRVAGTQPGESFGDALVLIRDVTGGGRAGLLVGAPRWAGAAPNEGRAVLLAGGEGGLAPRPVWEVRCEVPVRRGVDDIRDRLFGSVVAAAGDVNGDSFPDVLVTAPFAERGDVNEGLVLVYHGSPRGLPSRPSTILEANREISTLGGWAAGVGDVDGDGFDDVLAAACELSDDQQREGAAFLFRGSPRGLRRASSWSATGDRSHEELGLPSLALGDINGDGLADVAVAGRHGLPQSSPGVLRVHYGTPSGLRGSAALTTAKPWLRAVDQEWRRLSLAWRLALFALLLLGCAAAGAAAQTWWRRRTVLLVDRRETAARREERDRLARDLHDELGARLSRISLITERVLQEAGDSAPVKRLAQVVSTTAADLRQAMQALAGELRHGPDTAEGVTALLENHAAALLAQTGVRLLRDVPADLPAVALPPAVAEVLRPALREALANVLRHAAATEVWLRVRAAPGELVVEVEDNGRGFEPALVTRRSGLRNLEERVRERGGRFEFDSAPGQGTRVRFRLPLGPAAGQCPDLALNLHRNHPED